MLNKIILIGNVGTDVELRYTPNGAPVTNFRFAVSRKWTDGNGDRHDETEWFGIVCWNKLAELVNEYVQKGSKVYVEGRLQSKTWTAQDGSQRFNNDVVAHTVLFLDRAVDKSADSAGSEPVGAGADVGSPEGPS